MSTASAAQTFIDLWQSKDASPKAKAKLEEILSTTPLSGRMMYGNRKLQKGFGTYLSTDEWKKLSWVFGPQAIRRFLGMSSRDVCLELGFGQVWLDAKIAAGDEFVLAVFPSSSADAKQATWEGVEYLLEAHYPEVWNKISARLPQIKAMSSIEEMYEVAGYDMEIVNLVGRYDHMTGESHDERYVSLQRLVRREGTVVEVRQFLMDEIGLKRLYTGSGYTLNDDGETGPPEYLAQNKILVDIEGLATISVVPIEDDLCAEDGDMKVRLSNIQPCNFVCQL